METAGESGVVEVLTPFQNILTLILATALTVEELGQIRDSAQNRLETAEYEYGKLFELGDRVEVDGQTVTVVRRNKHTVTVASGGNVWKVVPSDITSLVEQGNSAEFDYWEYFGVEDLEPAEA